jgi:hypothetical protein
MKRIVIILAVLAVATASYGRALKPNTLPGFLNVSTVGEGTPWDSNAQPDEITWTVVTFGNPSTFELTLDASIDYPCSTGFYYPIGTMTEATTVRAQGIDLTGERCFRANLRSKTGFGGISSIKLNMRGL